MHSLREYIRIVETLDEGLWSKADAPDAQAGDRHPPSQMRADAAEGRRAMSTITRNEIKEPNGNFGIYLTVIRQLASRYKNTPTGKELLDFMIKNKAKPWMTDDALISLKHLTSA